jgi:hypothetical protein
MRNHPSLHCALVVALASSFALSWVVPARGAEDDMQAAPPHRGEAPKQPGDRSEDAVDPAYLPMPRERASQLASTIESATKRLESGSASHCWLSKLTDPKIDDRLIEWTRICPQFSREGLLAGRSCSVTAIQPDLLLDELPNAAAVDKADESLHIAVHLRSLVLAIGGRADVKDKLASLEEDVKTAQSELAKVKSDSRSRHYLALHQWLETRKGDPNSLYQSCSQ